MQSANQTESRVINKSPEMDVDRNVHEIKRAGSTFCQTDNDHAKMAANDLATLLGRVSEVSTREIENLISELHGLREKLKTDCDRIKGDVADYAELSQRVMQLTANISDSTNGLQRSSDNRQ